MENAIKMIFKRIKTLMKILFTLQITDRLRTGFYLRFRCITK